MHGRGGKMCARKSEDTGSICSLSFLVSLWGKDIISLVWGILDGKTMVNIADLIGMVLGFPETLLSPEELVFMGKIGNLIRSEWLLVHERS